LSPGGNPQDITLKKDFRIFKDGKVMDPGIMPRK